MERLAERAEGARWKDVGRSSDQLILSWDWRPATSVSSGDSKEVHWGITRAKTLYAPIKDFRRPTVSSLLQDARAAIRCGEAWRVPESQIQPIITVDLGLMTVLEAESLRLHLEGAWSTRFQFCSHSSGKSVPRYRSSALLATTPSWIRCPSTRHMSSSKAVSEPGMPIAERAYTRTPWNGVATPRYFIDSRHAWKFFALFRPRKVSLSPQSSSLKFCEAILPARQERKSVRLYRRMRVHWY